LLEWLKKGGLPKPLLRLQHLLKKALETTQTGWETLERVYGWVHQLAHVLGEEDVPPEERQLRFLLILMHMQEQASQLDPHWQQAIAHFLKVTQSYAPHLFFCYQIPDLPRTNNGLEQSFGSVRRSERRATGRRGAVPGLVVHGAVRVQAALATRVKIFTAQDLVPHDPQAWHAIRAQVSSHQKSRCKRSRFRKDPSAYLANLEHRLLSC
jgi:hypothetical protein